MKKRTILSTVLLAILLLSLCVSLALKNSTPYETSPSPVAETSETDFGQETDIRQHYVIRFRAKIITPMSLSEWLYT